jgi:hypothetical protein
MTHAASNTPLASLLAELLLEDVFKKMDKKHKHHASKSG